MTTFARRTALGAVIASAILVAGCATNIKATRKDNPPPKEAFSNFGRIEVRPVVLAPSAAGQQKVLTKIQENIAHDLEPSLSEWNGRPDNGRKLLIEPVVEEVRFIGIGPRILVGPLAGSSVVRMTVKITDASNGKLVDLPEFYQRSSAGAGFALGVADNMMLTRTAGLVSRYIVRNYAKAEGGPTGATDELVAPAATAATN